jgi:hypothetical protein
LNLVVSCAVGVVIGCGTAPLCTRTTNFTGIVRALHGEQPILWTLTNEQNHKPNNFRIVEAAISFHHKPNDMAETMVNITNFDGMLATRINMDKF